MNTKPHTFRMNAIDQIRQRRRQAHQQLLNLNSGAYAAFLKLAD